MKKIDTTNIQSGADAPYLADTHDHYGESIAELATAIVNGLYGSYTTNDVIILQGAVISGSGPYAVTSGWAFYNNEPFQIDAASGITPGGGETLVWKIATTYRAIDPIYYTNNVKYNTHSIRKIILTNGVSGSGIADYNAASVKRYNPYNIGTWTNLTLLNGYTSLGSNFTPQYRVDSNGYIQLRGIIQAPGTVTSTTFAKLPTGIVIDQYYTIACAPNILGTQYFSLQASMQGIPAQVELDISTASGGNVPASSQISIVTPILA